MAVKESTKGFLLRLDPDTMKMVEAWAAREFRSVNGQLQWIIHDSLRRHGLLKTDNRDNDTDNDRKE
jgi:hypothetical protein